MMARRVARPTQRGVGFRVSDQYVEQHPEADVSATELCINVLFAAELLGRELDQTLRPFGLGRGSHNVLQILGGATGPLTPTEVMARLTVTSATVTGLLDTLQTRGLARRRPHPSDRRSVLVEITDEGRALLDELVPRLIEREKQWAACLRPGQREQLIRLLGLLQGHLQSDDLKTETPRTGPAHDAAVR